jgi:hypothetical protein
MSEERWLPVVGYEGLYEVSDFGRVRSLDRLLWRPATSTRSGHYANLSGRILRPSFNQGRPGVNLCGDQRIFALVHSLVMRAFVGPRPKNLEVAHWDGDPSNNRLKNLRYASSKENSADAIRHNTLANGERHPGSKLSDNDVALIRIELKNGRFQKDVAEQFGVSRTAISAISTGRNWKFIAPSIPSLRLRHPVMPRKSQKPQLDHNGLT